MDATWLDCPSYCDKLASEQHHIISAFLGHICASNTCIGKPINTQGVTGGGSVVSAADQASPVIHRVGQKTGPFSWKFVTPVYVDVE